jgi:TolB-like protein/Flp pilus assembly protein TadD
MSLASGTRLGSYEILAPIGAGGMGEVYRARDAKLDREVAIKILPDSVSSDPDALSRFAREAKAVATLSHPNILSIHDFGTERGIAYAVVELLEGQTLRAKLEAGPVPAAQALEYARQIASGLSAAHEKGVVHRDLKPENLFVTRAGHVKILDFGIAKRLEPATPGDQTSAPTVSRQTEPGIVLGTLGYMSPEQVRGLPVDPRSDIFSFGVVLYELLSGKGPFHRKTAADTMSAILKDEPPAVGTNIPPAVDRLVRHCLEKDRDDRFQSARDIMFALSEASGPEPARASPPAGRSRRFRGGLIVAAALLLVVVAGILFLRRSAGGAGEETGVRRVAVLPFENVGAAEDDYFADGIADEVRGKLTSLPGVEVIARASSTPYRKTTKTPSQIARELDVKYLLTATVRWQKAAGASRVHVTPELVEVRGSEAPASRWQQPFDAALTDIFQVQSDIATRVAEALRLALAAGDEKRLAERPTQNLAAYDAFLKGEDVWRTLAVGTPAGVRSALSFYEQAVALDPGFARAWARISWAESSLYVNLTPTTDASDRARQAAEKAIALAPERPEGYHALGNFRRLVLGDPHGALEQYTKGQRFPPANADMFTATALAEESLGRWDGALAHLRQAERLDPRSVPTALRLGQALLNLRRATEAREALDRGLALAPANLPLIETRAMTFLAMGDLAGARSSLASIPREVEPTALAAYLANAYDLYWILDEAQRSLLVRLTPSAFDDDRGQWGICLAQAFAFHGDSSSARSHAGEARHALEEQLRAAPDDPLRRVALGLALAYLDRREEAVREGRRAVELLPIAKDAATGAYVQHQLARIYILVGRPQKALDALEPLLKIPYFLTPAWLRIDPNFDPLRNDPRFQNLVGS